ncbi:stage II sporulation protein D [Virgibacillus phasianinus]|uniref:Stage II sporulation protein D n=2 Tax=Virgibacillus phasianinus TaxID=2017483 RepID=A0A220U9A7_9BACI|nr:stage II sporulation protein D [Virgibacillus phasianinus]
MYAYIERKRALKYKQNGKHPQQIKGSGSLSFLKSPSFLIMGSLIMIILIMPSLIVAPYIHPNDQETITDNFEQKAPKLNVGDSPFSVAVMRASSDEVENIPLEKYVSGVVASEMPAKFELEALKAQALAARTYIVNHMLLKPEKVDSAVTDTVQDQVYKDEQELRRIWGADYDWKMNKIMKAVEATQGEILTYKDKPIDASFFSTGNGYTENSEDYWENKIPYLRSVPSPWDKNSPKFLDQETIPVKEVEEKLAIDIPDNKSLNLKISRTDGKRVDQLKIAGKTFSGRDVREELGLRSSDFTIEKKNDHLIFTTKGYGHGVGMSQYGANGMAKEGKSYKDILTHYYQGVEISKVTETAPTLVSR